jgi:hypothetical protein
MRWVSRQSILVTHPYLSFNLTQGVNASPTTQSSAAPLAQVVVGQTNYVWPEKATNIRRMESTSSNDEGPESVGV